MNITSSPISRDYAALANQLQELQKLSKVEILTKPCSRMKQKLLAIFFYILT